MIEYRREIDGLRALAVLPIILFHAGFDSFSGGFVGVDVFFVISGYLITSIILAEMRAGTFSLANFYERRVRRILPALFVVMAICIPFAWAWLVPYDMKGFSKSLAAVSLFLSNHFFLKESNYFDTSAELKPLLHTWSLAVEEQYYVVFPLLMLMMWRLGIAWIVSLLVVIAALSLSLAQWGAYNKPAAAFFLLPTRAWELAIGAFAAFYLTENRTISLGNVARQAWSMTGLLLILFAVFGFSRSTPFPGLYALIPTLGAALIILFATPNTLAGRLLGCKALVGIGLISYSAYLWHQPVFAFARHSYSEHLSGEVYALLSVGILVLAWTSWRYVERPFRSGMFQRRTLFLYALTGMTFFCIMGAWGNHDGLKDRFADVARLYPGYEVDNERLAEESWSELRRITQNEKYSVANNPQDMEPWFSSTNDARKILIVGNSHAKDLFNIFSLNMDLFSGIEVARFGTQISCFDEEREHPIYKAPNYRAADVIIVATRWSEDRSCTGGAANDFDGLDNLLRVAKQDEKKIIIASNSIEFRQYGSATIADNVVFKASRKLMRSPDEGERQILIDEINREHFSSRNASRRVATVNERLRTIARKHDVDFLEIGKFQCDEAIEYCPGITQKFEKIYYDYGHFTLAGARVFGTRAYEIGWLDLVE